MIHQHNLSDEVLGVYLRMHPLFLCPVSALKQPKLLGRVHIGILLIWQTLESLSNLPNVAQTVSLRGGSTI